MSAFFRLESGDEVFLNLSRRHRMGDGKECASQTGLAALASVKSAKRTGPASTDNLIAADAIFDEGICVSPYMIFGHPMHKEVCAHVNNCSDIGWSLREGLDGVGAFEFMETVKNKPQYEAWIERILAVFTMSSTGLTCIEDAPKALIHAVVDIFRTEDGADWNKEIFGANPIGIQCASNVIKGLARISGDDSLLEKARKHRRASIGKNPGFHAFQYSKNPRDKELLGYLNFFLSESKMRPTDLQSAVQHISAWLNEEAPSSTVKELVFNAKRPKTFTEYMVKKNGGKASRATFTIVNAARRLSVSISEQLLDTACGKTMFDLVTGKEHTKLNNKVKNLPKPDTARARPLSEKFVPLMREILEEGANGWPGKSRRFHENVERNGKTRSIYCPVIPSLFLVMLEIPLRMAQIRRLDTGEGDIDHFNADRMEWEKNEGPLAGFWAKKLEVGTSRTDTRGYARELEDEIKPVVGFNITTNKTGRPYVVPWFVTKVHQILWKLRKWQEKHNPISAPITPRQYVDNSEKAPSSTLEEMPDIFPISRLFRNKYHDYDGRIVTGTEMHRAWGYILQEVERRWNRLYPGKQVKIVDIHPTNRQPYRYKYTIHGLRVRGLTNLRRGGMPIELLSRFVAGHASVVMTLYYDKRGPVELSNLIEKAAANSDAQRQFIDDLKIASVEQAHEMAVSLSPAAVSEAFTSGSTVSFCNVTLGVCPFDGSRCSDGGELLRTATKGGKPHNVYGPVEKRNCVVCRHFLSGPPFVDELLAYGTKLCERRQFLAREEERILEELTGHEAALKNGDINKAFFENQYDSLQTEAIQFRDERETNENSIFNIELLCTASQRLLDNAQEGESKVMLVGNVRSSVVNFQDSSEFKQAVWITAHGRIHPLFGEDRVEATRDKYLNLIAEHASVLPPMLSTRFTEKQRRKAMDQYALFLATRVQDQDIARLIDGDIRLQDLRLEEQVREIIQTALSDTVLLPTPEATRRQLAKEAS